MKKYNCTDFLEYIENIARAKDGDELFFADLRADQLLRAAITDFPDDWRPTRVLTKRLMQKKRYAEALEINKARYASHPSDWRTFGTLLQLQLLVGQVAEANETFAAAPEKHQSTAVTHKSVINRMLKAMLDGDVFLQEDLDFQDIFFVPDLVGNAGAIKQTAASLGNKYYLEYIEYAKQYVEAAGGTFIYCTSNTLFGVENKSQTELDHLNHGIWSSEKARSDWLRSKPPHVVDQYGHFPQYSDDYLRQIFTGGKHIMQATRIVLADYKTDYVNVRNNLRVTTDVPKDASRRVLVLGASEAYGSGVEDKHTFSSHLQRNLNVARPDEFRVENHGTGGHPIPLCVVNLVQTRINPGDVVIMYGYPPLIDVPDSLSDLTTHHISFSRPHDYGEIYVDHYHVGPKGHEVIGGQLTDLVLDAKKNRKPTECTPHPIARSVDFLKYLIYRQSADVAESGRLKEYVSFLKDNKSKTIGKIGSVAVNCNPMTLGHLHLLEYAASSVDFLYVFVIEEDQSFFPFVDRLDIVTKGLSHLGNVVVLRGGQYICTQLTFPEYFSKDEVQEVAADASMEAWFFCEYIAKALNITTIFLGDEPNCEITHQYNKKMCDILPEYNIAVDIIPRISEGGAVISASSVRKLLADGDFAGIEKIVPAATYDYLVRKYAVKTAAE